jgi:ABC-2 type transport system ATP-binding protein
MVTNTPAHPGKGPAISVQALSKTYRNGWMGRRIDALKGVSFDVGQGEVFGLLGPNGAGKTTILKILLGIVRKSGGQASMLGFPAGDRRGRRYIGYLPEQLRIPRHLTGFTALDYYGRLGGLSVSDIRARRDGLLELTGLAGRGADRTSGYSKGMLQRLGIAQALLNKPQLLVLDEPTDGLDPAARAEVRTLMQRLRDEGVTVFLNSHLLQEVEMVCDRIAILNQGELRFCGTPDEAGSLFGTSATGMIRVRMEVAGNAELAQEMLVRRPGAAATAPVCERIEPRSSADGTSRFRVEFRSQAEIDSVIDGLRSSSISLVELTRESVTLEEAFLKLVGDSPAHGNKPDRPA